LLARTLRNASGAQQQWCSIAARRVHSAATARGHAQFNQRSQTAQAGRNATAERVVVEPAANAAWRLSSAIWEQAPDPSLAGHAQIQQLIQVAQARRDATDELVSVEIAANTSGALKRCTVATRYVHLLPARGTHRYVKEVR
jgi:hypothetical protein